MLAVERHKAIMYVLTMVLICKFNRMKMIKDIYLLAIPDF